MYVVSICIQKHADIHRLNPTMWNIKGKTGFLYMGTALVITAWSWFRLPETRVCMH